MRIIYIGSVEFSLKALKKVIEIGGDVVGVCTLKKSSFNADFCDLSNYSNESNIPYLYSDDINSSESINWISEKNPDVIFCFGWSKLLKSEILSIAPMGVIGFHPTSLPENRGRHPLIWALALGLKSTASTFFFMDEFADSGDILSQSQVSINDDDDARDLYDKICFAAIEQIEEFMPLLINGSYPKIKQDHSKSNIWRKRNKSDGLIDWRMSADSIHNTVRALSKPYIGAEFIHNDVNYKLWETEIIKNNNKNIEPGKVLKIVDSDLPIIKCGINAIKIIESEPKLEVKKGTYI